MSIEFRELNFLAILIAAIGTFLLGAVWYTVLFGKRRTEAMGYTEEELALLARASARNFGFMFIAYLAVAFVLASLIQGLGITSFGGGAALGALVWFGLAAAIGLTGHLVSTKPLSVFLIDIGFQLVFLALAGGLLAVWQ